MKKISIDLNLIYENQYGRIYQNKEYRVWTLELNNFTEEDHKKFFEEFENAITAAQEVLREERTELTARLFRKMFEIKLFIMDKETSFIINEGEWNPIKSIASCVVSLIDKNEK